MALSKMEFAVERLEDAEGLKSVLAKRADVSRVEVLAKDSLVVLESTLTCSQATALLQDATRGSVVLQGLGDGNAAVSIVEGEGVRGVIRFGGVVDGTLDGLPEGPLRLNVHTAGDLSRGCASIGPLWEPHGHLATVTADPQGRAHFKFPLSNLKVDQLIGRAIAVSTDDDNRLACGVIARSAGLFQNSKKICACDGITLWDEKYVPAAGAKRRDFVKEKS